MTDRIFENSEVFVTEYRSMLESLVGKDFKGRSVEHAYELQSRQ